MPGDQVDLLEAGEHGLTLGHDLGADHPGHVERQAHHAQDQEPDLRVRLPTPGVDGGRHGHHACQYSKVVRSTM